MDQRPGDHDGDHDAKDAERPDRGDQRRGEQNELEYYNRPEGGPQRDSGGQETPGPVSDRPQT